MKKIILVFLLCVSSCGSLPKQAAKIDVMEVKVPVAVACKAIIPEAPAYNFKNKKQEDDIYIKSAALLADRILYESYINDLLAALKSCTQEIGK